jgi:sulfopyruvate decarboxylase subunit beta
MNKHDAIQAIIAATTDQPTVFTTGYTCRIARAMADRPTHFYMTGSMGLASSVGFGVAVTSGLVTVVVDGDGSVLMNPVGLITVGAHRSLPLVHVVLDDGRYASTGGQSVPSRPDLAALAQNSGYLDVHDTHDTTELTELLEKVLACCTAPTFIRCDLHGAEPPVPARVDTDLGDHAMRFASALQAMTGGRA